ncbi:hypothetical protein AAGV27_14810 [Bacillus velezensis]
MELLQPNQYFEMIKSKKNKVTDKELQRYYDNCLVLLNKYKQTNQIKAAKETDIPLRINRKRTRDCKAWH